jgi:hypothetical protein
LKLCIEKDAANMFPLNSFRQLGLIGMNSVEAKKTFPQESTFHKREQGSAWKAGVPNPPPSSMAVPNPGGNRNPIIGHRRT